MAVSIRIDSNLPLVQKVFAGMHKLAGNPQPLLQAIAMLGESSTRARFDTKTAPDGAPWKRGLKTGDDTLHKDGHLVGSVSNYFTRTEAVWGVNRIYAAIHQFGGTIKAKSSGGLRFKIGERWSTKSQVTIPARPFLGVSATDEQDILELASNHISALIRRTAPGGA